jgi:hypothetical protein|tara:strand:- start:1427 stop:1825 length:399 start_codon:yes stop_codon:yes gene_type:complete
MGKHKSRTKVTDVFNITSKLRGCDAVSIGEHNARVATFTEKNPLLLWNAIHKKSSKISLVRPAYYNLKKAVRQIAPEKVIKVEKIRELHKAKRKLAREITYEMNKKKGNPNIDLIKSKRKVLSELKRINIKN